MKIECSLLEKYYAVGVTLTYGGHLWEKKDVREEVIEIGIKEMLVRVLLFFAFQEKKEEKKKSSDNEEEKDDKKKEEKKEKKSDKKDKKALLEESAQSEDSEIKVAII